MMRLKFVLKHQVVFNTLASISDMNNETGNTDNRKVVKKCCKKKILTNPTKKNEHLTLLHNMTHILIVHIPVGSLSIWNHLPHDNAVTPHVAGRCELPVGDGLGCRPPDGDLASGGEVGPSGLLKQPESYPGWVKICWFIGRFTGTFSA